MLWETSSSPPALENIINQKHFFDLVQKDDELQLQSADTTYQSVISNILADTSYLIEIKYERVETAGGNHSVITTINLTKLVLAGNTEFTGTVTATLRDSAYKYQLHLSDAQTGINSVSSIILIAGTDTTLRALCKDYLINRWKNIDTEPAVDPDAVDSAWLTEIRY